jgi:putative membrane protein
VQTAGGGPAGQPQTAREREWLAPILRAGELPSLVHEVLPGIDVAALEWHPPHARAFRRAVKPALALALAAGGGIAYWNGGAALVATPLLAAWSAFATWKGLAHLGWAETGDVVAFRSGWLWRSLTLARLSKVQVVSQVETPFDRRWAMRRVRVDTAGGGMHRIDIPYLGRDTATALHGRLAAAAATTDFRW